MADTFQLTNIDGGCGIQVYLITAAPCVSEYHSRQPARLSIRFLESQQCKLIDQYSSVFDTNKTNVDKKICFNKNNVHN